MKHTQEGPVKTSDTFEMGILNYNTVGDLIESMENKGILIEYIHKGATTQKIGVLVALSNASNSFTYIKHAGLYLEGFSLACKKDRNGKFNKVKGLQIALGRALKGTKYFSPSSISSQRALFLERCKKYYKNLP